MIWMALLAVSCGIAHREHIGVEFVFARLPAPVHRWVALAFDLTAFAFPHVGVASRVMTLNSGFGETFASDIEDETELKVLGLPESGGFFAFTNSERPITSLEDIEGLRIRTMTLAPRGDDRRARCRAHVAALAEVYTALQTGVADGQMNPIPISAFANFDEVQDYLSIANHGITPYIWTMTEEFYNSLTPEHQYLVSWAAEVATEAGRGMNGVI